ncbi:SCP-like protein [Ancylostoma duodenale]|uniref:SCP-like protein n=1 Tax=Ancylostoma duodenale TaxID=51022 RepID=A0A0C2C9T4_9BILA|nr:SCP-like protein [Ancylostoma duodenale]
MRNRRKFHNVVCDIQTYPTFTEAERKAILDAHNDLREKIAAGNQPNFQGKLPPAKNMYQLQYDCKMEEKLQKEIDGCSGHATLSEQYGQNILVQEEVLTTSFSSSANYKNGMKKYVCCTKILIE